MCAGRGQTEAAEGSSAGEIGLALAGALHAGFQPVVTVVVHPALAAVGQDGWPPAHAAHSRRIGFVVPAVYPLVAGGCLWVVPLVGPYDVLTLVAVGSNALAGSTTALAAAPTHRRLGREGPTPVLVRRLLLADRLRLAGAGLAAVTATLALPA